MSNSVTGQVYGIIRDGDYANAILILQTKLGEFPRSRPLLSLIAYCCYHNQEFARAAEFYETLTELHPKSEEYQVYYVQALVKGGSHLDASRVASSAAVTSKSRSRMRLLQAHAELEQGMLPACATTLSQCQEDPETEAHPETIVALATLDFREGRYAKALETYKIAKQVMGDQPMLAYYIALCHYQLSDYDAALEGVDNIIEEGREGQIGSHDDLHQQDQIEPFLAEALNLKAAVLYTTKKFEAAKDSMKELCELQDNENLDTLTIHNDAIINIEEDPSIGIQKLEFLLSNQCMIPETLSNLLTFYISHGQDNLAGETFERNKHLAQELLPPDAFAYFDAVMMSHTCPDDAFSMLETQISQYAPKLRSGKSDLSKAIKSVSARPNKPATSVRPNTAAERKGHRALAVATKEFEAILDRYIPVLMLQARLYWEKEEYLRAEQILRKSAIFCHDRDAWRMNMGHIMFAQKHDDFETSIEHYEILLKHNAEADLLKVPAVALANLCVAYIMTNQNEAAEEVIKTVEREEQQQIALGNDCERTYHTCVINLIIGTLYCERGNFEFGVSRICKSMEPFEKNLCPDTWFYAKRCFLELASKVSKVMYIIKDNTLHDILCFFDDVESNGKQIVIEKETANSDEKPATISSEAKELKNVFLKICSRIGYGPTSTYGVQQSY